MRVSVSDEPTEIDNLDIAVAHWHVNAWGGAEYLVTKLAEAVSVDHVYTLGEPEPDHSNPYGAVTFEDVTAHLGYTTIRRLQQHAGRVFEYSQWEDVDWREFGSPDVLITSGATTRAVITPDDTLHLNYCHSPPRWFYDLYHDRKVSIVGALTRSGVRYLRMRDMAIDPRVDHYLVNSPIIRRRLWKYYKRDSEVLYPPVELNRYYNNDDHGFYLHLGRLDEQKGVPAVVGAFERLDDQLVMAGGAGDVDKSVLNQIKRADNIEWRGFVDESEKLRLLSQCSALVFNGQNEDFGIVLIEANASGKPVISREDGFPSMFVDKGDNGIVHDGTKSDIEQAINKMREVDFPTTPETYASPFSFERFSENIQAVIQTSYNEFQKYSHQSVS
jgi:glycosyltransferase involved in cell wall biosynthesis